MQQWRRAFLPSLGSSGLLESLAWGCAHTHQSNGEAGHGHGTWVCPMATLLFSRSRAWNSSSIACREGAHHGTAQETPTPSCELLKWGAETSSPHGHPARVHPALPSFPPPLAKAHLPSPKSQCKDFPPPRLSAAWGVEICSCRQDFPSFAATPGLAEPWCTGRR